MTLHFSLECFYFDSAMFILNVWGRLCKLKLRLDKWSEKKHASTLSFTKRGFSEMLVEVQSQMTSNCLLHV